MAISKTAFMKHSSNNISEARFNCLLLTYELKFMFEFTNIAFIVIIKYLIFFVAYCGNEKYQEILKYSCSVINVLLFL